MTIAKLHCITQDIEGLSHTEQAALAIKGGANWIQLRAKEIDWETTLEEAKKIKELCAQHGAVFIINDHVDICKEVGAHGVHLGHEDMPIPEARNVLGEDAIIGGTANSFADFRKMEADGADYIGLGPMRYSPVKKVGPTIGLEGYRRLVKEGASIPVVAIGGVVHDDVFPIMNMGVHGVAVSSAIFKQENPEKATADMLEVIENHYEHMSSFK